MTSNPPHPNDRLEPVRHLEDLDQLLIDAEADDEGVQQASPVVLRDLFLLKEDKELSYGERKMLDTAKNLLVKELSLAKQMDQDKVERQIEKIFC